MPINKNNHTNTAAKAGTAVDSTCITHGHEDDIYCLDCGNKVTNGKILPLDPKAHGSLRTINQLSASCTNKGYSGDTICSNCNKVIRKGVVTNYKPHAIVSIIEKASLSTSGSIIKVCENCNKIIGFSTISPVSNIKIKNPVYTYNNKTITPALSVKDLAGNELRKNTDYTVSYAKGRKNVGKYAVTVKFKGNYTGSKTLYFTINPQSTKISGLSAKRNQIRIKWKAKKTQTSGYEIQYSTNKNFKKSKITKVNKNKTTAAKITGLKGGKKYYIRIRTYKKVGNKKYYSGWSGIKNIKTKK